MTIEAGRAVRREEGSVKRIPLGEAMMTRRAGEGRRRADRKVNRNVDDQPKKYLQLGVGRGL